MPDEPKNRRVCPSCGQSNGFWENVMVQGWREIDEYLEPVPGGDHDTDFSTAEPDSWASYEIGCSCGWNGQRREAPKIGIDGEPLRVVHPDQMEIA